MILESIFITKGSVRILVYDSADRVLIFWDRLRPSWTSTLKFKLRPSAVWMVPWLAKVVFSYSRWVPSVAVIFCQTCVLETDSAEDRFKVFWLIPFTLKLTPSELLSHPPSIPFCQLCNCSFSFVSSFSPFSTARIFFTMLISKSSKSHWLLPWLASRTCFSCSAIIFKVFCIFFCRWSLRACSSSFSYCLIASL